ncbi:hypothetical protein BWQ96_06733 [Gracilariopsis chorda]|uniref:Uncharacterized protein n=1 Tax=Gracilariopsis chorda TaxID=448386 RepID=A0A2V3IN84_9FLOR|nr:hypothetical protein BWQ96_09604 [Gracilariopsis chorda]PXF43532.1 hypothetical protein BWQ96_06733 [Gracilariopsis chorda]|eukprot:PXF40686.1 hypothetical protein BWQ96_09604 [Gracilariopsis chorda]
MIRDKYNHIFRNHYELGSTVEARKGNNALGNYFPCKVILVRQAPLSNETGVYAEKNIAAKLVFTLGGVLDRKKYTYDLQYEDGSVDKHVRPDSIRPVVQPVQHKH